MKKIKIRSDYDCLIKHEEGETFLDGNSEICFDKPEKILVYPLSQKNKNTFPFAIDLESPENTRFFSFYSLKEFNLIYISSSLYIQNEITEIITTNKKECKVKLSEDYISFDCDNQKKTVFLNQAFSDYSIKTLQNLLFLHLISENELMFVFNLNDKTLKEFSGKKIELFENHLSVAKEVNDIANHVIFQTFEIKDDKIILQKDTLKYNFEKPVLITNPLVVPIAFLEAIKLEDFDLAKHYLCEGLKTTTSENHLKKYFGEFLKIIPIEDYVIGIITPENLKVFEFKIENGLIVDINEKE